MKKIVLFALTALANVLVLAQAPEVGYEPIDVVRRGMGRLEVLYEGRLFVIRTPSDSPILHTLAADAAAAPLVVEFARQYRAGEGLRVSGLILFSGGLAAATISMAVNPLAPDPAAFAAAGIAFYGGGAIWLVSKLVRSPAFATLERACDTYNERGARGAR